MTDLSPFQLIIVAVVYVMAAGSTGLLLLIGVVHLKEKYAMEPRLTTTELNQEILRRLELDGELNLPSAPPRPFGAKP